MAGNDLIQTLTKSFAPVMVTAGGALVAAGATDMPVLGPHGTGLSNMAIGIGASGMAIGMAAMIGGD